MKSFPFQRIFFWVGSLLLLLTVIFLFPYHNSTLLNRLIVSRYYFHLAKKFPTNSYESLRYEAIGQSLKSGDSEYHFNYDGKIAPSLGK